MYSAHPVEPEEIMAYIDGELPVERASAAAAHMASCGDCQRVAANFRGLSRRLAEWEVEEYAAEIPVARRRRWVRFVGWGAGLAAAAGIVLTVSVTPRLHSDYQLAQYVRTRQLKEAAAEPAVPLVIRTAEIALTTAQFDRSRAALDEIVRRHSGYTGQLSLTTPPGAGRILTATLRVPAPQFNQTLAEVRALGHLDSESQHGEEVTRQVIDLDARIANSQTTEQRLRDLLRQRTGTVGDVLEVEKELARVRGEIERMQAERKDLGDRVSFAQIAVRVTEEYKTHAGLRAAAVEVWRNLTGGVVGVGEFLLEYGLSLLLWGAVLFFPARWVWRRVRH